MTPPLSCRPRNTYVTTLQIPEHESVRCSLLGAQIKFRESIKVGMLVHGRVVGIENYGAFVKLDHSDLTVLLHISKISWARIRDVKEVVDIGDRVSGMVGTIESEGGRNMSIQILTKVLERERGEIVRRKNFAEVMQQAGERVREYRYVHAFSHTHTRSAAADSDTPLLWVPPSRVHATRCTRSSPCICEAGSVGVCP